MNQRFFLFIILIHFVSLGQTRAQELGEDVNYKDITEIKGLIYYKADMTLVSGKVIRYNRKNEAKRYILVSKGKPDNLGWIHINDNYEIPKESDLGNILKAGIVLTGAAMAVTGNAIKLPLNKPNRTIDNTVRGYFSEQKDITLKSNREMSDRVDIYNHLNSADKKSDGPYKEYNYDGQLKIKGNFIDEKKNGIWDEFYDSGQLKSKGNYLDGKKEGKWQEYYENGFLENQMKFEKGIKVGLLKRYHSKGQLLGRINYKNGKEHGVIEAYYENGQLMMIGEYQDGKQIGEWRYYNEKGKLSESEIHDN